MTLTHRLEIRLENRLSEIPRALDAVDSFFEEVSPDGPARFDVAMALEELISNIIRYGYPEQSAHEICLTMKVQDNSVHCELVDSGKAFDPLSLPAPDIEAGLEDREIGGLGIHLVRETMEHISYERINGRNVLRLVRSLGGGKT